MYRSSAETITILLSAIRRLTWHGATSYASMTKTIKISRQLPRFFSSQVGFPAPATAINLASGQSAIFSTAGQLLENAQ